MAANAYFAHARTDGRDWLIEADEPLAGLQLRSGGELPGIVAAAALLELVRKARRYGLKLARAIEAQDGREQVTAWIEVAPEAGGEGCTIAVANWQTAPLPPEDPAAAEERRAAIERHLAELSARLGPDQEVIAVESDSAELAGVAARLREGLGRRWTDLLEVEGERDHRRPLPWRLLDGARVSVPGSARHW
ncbi:MAG: sensor histidine kinase, partial [Porphyrobacter sp.]|nr:sensor histidine kinase [Porphyrobacter sp.]